MPFLAKDTVPIPTKDILSWACEGPEYDQDAPLYIDAANPSTTLSARQTKSLVRHLIAGFRAAGLHKGDTVLIHSFNSIYYPVIVLGIIGAGCIYTGTNPSYTPAELEHAIRASEAKFILSEPELLPALRVAARQLRLPDGRIHILDSTSKADQTSPTPAEYSPWRSLLSHGAADWATFDDEQTSKTTTAMLCFSSGTTGLPKAAQISHYNLVAQHTLAFEHNPRPYSIKRLVFLPMFHVSTAPMCHTSPLRAGHAQVIMRRWDVDAVLSHVPAFGITDLVLVPPMITALVSHALPAREKRQRLKGLRWAIAGAAPLDAAMQARCQTLLPRGILTQIWAMTETTCLASVFPYGEPDATGSVGRFLPNLDVKLLDGAGADITAYGVRGELAVRGPTVFRGYVGVPRARDFDAEGYFRTGDIVWGDAATGKWYVVDRVKELIKVRGFQVAPAELEGVLLSHPGILDAAVVGVPSPETGSELPRAYVVRRVGWEDVSEGDVAEWVQERLAKYKRLEGGVRFVRAGEIPKTASGKIKKQELREMAGREIGAKL
ncbi:acetyl-CoA synthetase-like protein [Paraphaeosphaeria sporulosa]|uniref:Acetyl-CoA synthetase-like protein n=1 Tax=Paraphaeosphaeria sporulosa TaxID=1460663 RepID=A0A177CSQ6_9PLEO|nr:acetyl-CoA synthetase-like protein [Paraphaeosphaeria sporulosa]OAG10565.1 acetyl-CoA synthetase-like protein [Paraphaeosphaeria sporulosa]